MKLALPRPSIILASLAALALTACAGPSATERFYALNDGGVVVSPSVKTGATNASEITTMPGIVVSAVTVPELVDRPQIVTRDSTNRVVVSEQNLWAESIRSGVARTLATRLARAMDRAGRAVQVAAYPQTSIPEPYLRITVDLIRFDAVPNGEAVIDALWSVRRVADGAVHSGRTVASSPIAGTSYDAIVHSWNEALESVDRDITATVLDMGPAPAPTKR